MSDQMNVMSKVTPAKAVASKVIGLVGTASLRTPCGPRRAENIRPGDLVVTRDDGLQAVRMVWSRTVTEAEIAADPSLAPVRLKPRAIGPLMPQRDLLLAGDHRILVPGHRLVDMPDESACLISARDIAEASDEAYFDKSRGDVTFYNIVFDAHQIFCADGLPVESFVPSKKNLSSMDAAAKCQIKSLFPDAKDLSKAMPVLHYSEPASESYRPEFV